MEHSITHIENQYDSTTFTFSFSNPQSIAMATKTVCVTGASGFIASWLVKFLLQRGYTVNATVRDPNDVRKTQHLLSLDGAKERLKLFGANLSAKGAFDAAVAGCEGVFHTASPFFFETSDPQKDLIDPAVEGTINVLESVTKTPSVKRVVLTSSEAAIVNNTIPKTAETVVDETWWSDPDYCREKQIWYLLSKTLAEKAAWDFVKEKGIDLVSINPPAVSGTTLPPKMNTSCNLILNLINGAEAYPNMAFGWVDVKDVAEAHILAFEKPEAKGRYYVVEKCYHQLDVVNTIRELYPNLKLPEKCADNGPLAAVYKASNERAKQLGVVFTPFKQSIKETIDSFMEKGFFKGAH